MNTKAFTVLFFNLACLYFAEALFFTDTGTGVTVFNGALTIPLATASGAGTLATPLAVLGVLKLGAAALFALGYLTLGDDEEEAGYGDYRKRRVLRQKRQANGEAINVPDKESLFALISAMDTYGCGKQLICELEAKNPRELQRDELLMVRLFSKGKNKFVNPASPKAEYDLAAELGMASKNEVLCRARFASCPYTGPEMMAALRNSRL